MHDPLFRHERRAQPDEPAAREIATLADDPASDDDAVLRVVPDLRGVPVDDASGLSVGELWGALVEAETGLIRYVDLDLQSADRHVLVPIGHARVRDDPDEGPSVRLRAALLEELEQIPPFPADVAHIDDPFERALLEAYGRTFHGERYYAHPAYDHHGIYAGEHAVVADDGAIDDPTLNRLAYLSGWRVAKGEPDIRGWPLHLTGDDTSLRVQDLIVDPGARRVRYVVVPTPDGENARLLPIGFLRVDRDTRAVIADGLDAGDVNALPQYPGGGVTRDLEDRTAAELRRRLDGARRYTLPDYRSA